jgi:hypothetical protein
VSANARTDTTSGVIAVAGSGQKRPPKIATGSNSAAKLVPQRSEKRDETPFLERGDRTMLCTVQVERAAAQEPTEQSKGRDETCSEPKPVRREREHQRSDDRRGQKESFATARNTLTFEQR